MSIDDGGLNLMSRSFIQDPHPILRELRAADPVHWSEHHRAWVLTGHEDVRNALRNPVFSSDQGDRFRGVQSPVARRILGDVLSFMDPPKHTRLRSLVGKAFTPRRVKQLEDGVSGLVDELLVACAEHRGPFDFVEAFAFPLPAWVIAELMGVPPGDRDLFRAWAEAATDVIFRTRDREQLRKSEEAFAELDVYFEELVERYRKSPEDNLLCGLIAAEEEGDKLSATELRAMSIAILIAGHETTMSLLTSAVWLLDQREEARELLRSQPSLIEPAVEELLRFEGPAKTLVRTVTKDETIRDKTLHAGDRVFVSLAGANRDPDVFVDPDELDIARNPNPHVAFGHGAHFCLGASLARMEARVALSAIYDRFPNLTVCADELDWRPVIVTRSLMTLPVQVD